MKSLATLPSTTALVCLLAFAPTLLLAQDPAKKDGEPAAAPKETVELPETLATVNGEKISRAEVEEAFETFLRSTGRGPADIPPEARTEAYQMILQDMITEKLITAKASSEKVSDEEVAAKVKELEDSVGGKEQLAEQLKSVNKTIDDLNKDVREATQQQKWIDSQIADQVKVTDADAKAFYDGNSDLFKQPELVRASHILLTLPDDASEEDVAAKKKEAEALRKEITDGKSFKEVAAAKSEDPGSKERGGDLNFFPKDRMVPEFADAAYAMKVGEISEPVRSPFGVHIIKVTDKKEARTVPIEEAKPRILEHLDGQKRSEAFEKLIAKLRAESEVTVNMPMAEAAVTGQ